MTFTVQEREAFKKAIQKFTVKNPSKKKSEIVAHFVLQGVARSTVYKYTQKNGNFSENYWRKEIGPPKHLDKYKTQKTEALGK